MAAPRPNITASVFTVVRADKLLRGVRREDWSALLQFHFRWNPQNCRWHRDSAPTCCTVSGLGTKGCCQKVSRCVNGEERRLSLFGCISYIWLQVRCFILGLQTIWDLKVCVAELYASLHHTIKVVGVVLSQIGCGLVPKEIFALDLHVFLSFDLLISIFFPFIVDLLSSLMHRGHLGIPCRWHWKDCTKSIPDYFPCWEAKSMQNCTKLRNFLSMPEVLSDHYDRYFCCVWIRENKLTETSVFFPLHDKSLTGAAAKTVSCDGDDQLWNKGSEANGWSGGCYEMLRLADKRKEPETWCSQERKATSIRGVCGIFSGVNTRGEFTICLQSQCI